LKNIFIKDINESSNICDYFLVKKKELNKSKNDKYYLALKLCDKSGEIEARVWDRADYLTTLFNKGDVILIKRGAATVYQKRMQINIADLEKAAKDDVDLSDFMETAKRPLDEMLNELKGYFKDVKNSHLRKLLNLFFQDKAFTDKFCSAPAAKTLHHSYLCGLLEHTLSVTRLVTLFKKNYPELNEDILITGAVLHDIGKIKELSRDVGFEYTDTGRLLGHIVIGTIMIDKKIEQIKGFPVRLADVLKHMILSHHGNYEWGSPKRPKTLEALVLHYADDLDAKIAMFQRLVNRDVRDEESGWTSYDSFFERYLFKDAGIHAEGPAIKEEKEEQPKKSKKAPLDQINMFEDEL
jgi:3'-5' exoribonuclease